VDNNLAYQELLQMSDKILNNPRGVNVVNDIQQKQRLDVPVAIKPSVLNGAKPITSREPIDYSNVPISSTTQKASELQFNDTDILNIVKGALAEKQTPLPVAFDSVPQNNPFQKDIIHNLKNNNYPVPAALR
jgi:hypothetical protein